MNFYEALASGFFKGKEPLFDSRMLSGATDKYIFFALQGEKRDGHNFVRPLYALGVRYFVIQNSRQTDFSDMPDAKCCAADSVLAALQDWAAWHRQQFSLPVLGIAGSYGKTIVKEWVAQLLEGAFLTAKSPLSYNSQLGVPISVLALRDYHQLAIFEAGISQKDEMAQLAKIIAPNVGLFTNLGEAHAEGFDNLEQKALEKAQFFAKCPTIFYNANSSIIENALAQICPKSRRIGIHIATAEHEPMLVSDDNQDLIRVQLLPNVMGKAGETRCTVFWAGSLGEFVLPFEDWAAIQNAVQAMLVAVYLGLPLARLNESLAELRPIPMRLEQKEGSQQTQIIDDSYTNDPQSMFAALDFARRHAKYTARWLVFSAFLRESPNIYAELAERAAAAGINGTICVGGQNEHIAPSFEELGMRWFHFEHTEDLLEALQNRKLNFEKATILLKASRSYRFERVALQLQQRQHDTRLLVNLSAIRQNYNHYRCRLRQNSKTMAMVKASAYGSSSPEIAHLLAGQGVDYLGVAYPDEGIALRQQGLRQPILVMNVGPEAYNFMLEYGLEPVLYNRRSLEGYIDFLQKHKAQGRAHLEIDTGMRRLGFAPQEAGLLFETLKAAKDNLEIVSVFSHLAAAEAPAHDEFTRQQITVFQQFCEAYYAAMQQQPLRHILNSAGVSRWRDIAEFDMVRLGICLHGIDSTNTEQLQPVAALQTVISQIRELDPAQTVGYGRAGHSDKPTRVATIAIGYADGFRRAAGNGRAKVWINGQLCPTIGNVCMDMAFVDLGDCPAKEGDTVVIFGPQLPIEQAAHALDTIPYELLTNVGARIPRIFFED